MLETPRLVMVLAATMLLLIGVGAAIYETAWIAPAPHPTISQIEVGGGLAIEDGKNWWLGLAFGLVMIALLTVCLTMAADQISNGGSLRTVTLLGGLAYAAVFTVLMFAYRDYATAPVKELWGPFPAPTTIMVFGFWFVPFLFPMIYGFGFYRWFDPERDQAADSGIATSGASSSTEGTPN